MKYVERGWILPVILLQTQSLVVRHRLKKHVESKLIAMFRPPPIFRKKNDLFIYDRSLLNKNQVTEAPKTGVSMVSIKAKVTARNHFTVSFLTRCSQSCLSFVRRAAFTVWSTWAIESDALSKGEKINSTNSFWYNIAIDIDWLFA